jgi:hypothetical protein
MAREGLLGVLALGALLGAGCARPAPHRSDALDRSRALLERADSLEAELHAQAAVTDLYGELGARRQETTQIACEVAESHLREIHRLHEQQMAKRKARPRRRLALLSHPAP